MGLQSVVDAFCDDDLLYKEEKKVYSILFYKALNQGKEPYIGGLLEEIGSTLFLSKSGLPNDDYLKIWKLTHKNFSYDRKSFFKAMKLVALAQSGEAIDPKILKQKYFYRKRLIPKFKNVTTTFTPIDIEKFIISEDEYEEWENVFNDLKSNADSISKDDIRKIIFPYAKLSSFVLSDILNMADKDKSGRLDLKEFLAMMFFIMRVREEIIEKVPARIPSNLWKSINYRHEKEMSYQISKLSLNYPSDYPISKEQMKNYDRGYDSLAEDLPAISKFSCLRFCNGTDLSYKDISKIWNLADINGNKELTREEFYVFYYLVEKAEKGEEIPSSLPPNLIPPSLRNKRKDKNREDSSNVVFPSDYPISEKARKGYDDLFDTFCLGKDYLIKSIYLPILQATGVSLSDLEKLWDLSNVSKTGNLNREEYYTFSYLLTLRKTGLPIPSKLPDRLIPPSYRKNLPSDRDNITYDLSFPPEYPINRELRKNYDNLFDKFSDDKQYITMESTVFIFVILQISREESLSIWKLVDFDENGERICRDQFYIAMFLIGKLKAGEPLPNNLPACLYPPSYWRTHKNTDPRFGSDFPIPKKTVINYDNLFDYFAHGDQYITLDMCLPLFTKTGLTRNVLKTIYNVVDVNNTGRLTRELFYGFVYLTTLFQQTAFMEGYIPSTMPEKLLPLSLRNTNKNNNKDLNEPSSSSSKNKQNNVSETKSNSEPPPYSEIISQNSSSTSSSVPTQPPQAPSAQAPPTQAPPAQPQYYYPYMVYRPAVYLTPSGQPVYAQPPTSPMGQPVQPVYGQPPTSPSAQPAQPVQPVYGQPPTSPSSQPAQPVQQVYGQPPISPTGQPAQPVYYISPPVSPNGQPARPVYYVVPQGPVYGQAPVTPGVQPVYGQPPQPQPVYGQPPVSPGVQPVYGQPTVRPVYGQSSTYVPSSTPQNGQSVYPAPPSY